MFGLALSTYHHKVRRLSESRSVRGRSLWEATLAHVSEHGPIAQADLLKRFHYDDEASVRGVLLDLVESGLVFRSGRGDRTTYPAARPDELALLHGEDPAGGAINLVWLAVHRSGPTTLAELEQLVPFERDALQVMVDGLVKDGRVERSELRDVVSYDAKECVIALG